jgi:hypothetical protein
MWVEMNAREVKMVAAHSSDSLMMLADGALVSDVSAEQGYAKVCGNCGEDNQEQRWLTCGLK